MVIRARLKAFLTGVALYAIAAMLIGYFGVNAYTGKYGLNARQELDQEIIALTSELARLKRERADGVRPGRGHSRCCLPSPLLSGGDGPPVRNADTPQFGRLIRIRSCGLA